MGGIWGLGSVVIWGQLGFEGVGMHVGVWVVWGHAWVFWVVRSGCPGYLRDGK